MSAVGKVGRELAAGAAPVPRPRLRLVVATSAPAATATTARCAAAAPCAPVAVADGPKELLLLFRLPLEGLQHLAHAVLP